MKFKKKLKYGETPYDNLTREDLLLLVKRHHAALSAAQSCLAMFRHSDPTSGFWGTEGFGGIALAKVDFCLKPFQGDTYGENIFRSFFRYADHLLFEGVPGTSPWAICDKCGTLLGGGRGQPMPTTCLCKKPMRAFAWKDLAPLPE